MAERNLAGCKLTQTNATYYKIVLYNREMIIPIVWFWKKQLFIIVIVENNKA